MRAANDQHLLALLSASKYATPSTSPRSTTGVKTGRSESSPAFVAPASSPQRSMSSGPTDATAAVTNNTAAWDGAVPSDFLRCNAALAQLKCSLDVVKRCEDLTKSIKYANDDITSMAIASFSKTDLWRALGYRGGPDDAKMHMRRQQLEAKGVAMRAAAILATTTCSSFSGGSASTAQQAATVLSFEIDDASRLRQATEQGGVLADESSEALIAILGFLQELVDGKLVSTGVTRTPLEFPDGHLSPRSSDRRRASSGDGSTSSPLSNLKAAASSSKKRPSQTTFNKTSVDDTDAPLIKAPRQKELDIHVKYAHDRETRAVCIEEERRFQRIIVLQVLALVAVQQLEADIAIAKERLLTCELLQHRADQNPLRALDDHDLQQCIALVPEFQQTLARAATQLSTFEQKHRKRFHRALAEGVGELCAFNREVHRWNHHVEHRARRHRNSIRRSYQSCFTVLSKLENGELSLDKQPEIFVKLQLFEKLDSTITLARQAQELLIKYKRRLCSLDRVPNDHIRAEDIARWQVDLKKPKRQKEPQGKQPAGGKRKKSTASSRRSSRGSAPSSRNLSPQANKPLLSAPAGKAGKNPPPALSTLGSRRGSAISMCSSRNSHQTEVDVGGGNDDATGPKPPKRWRFKLFDEAHDEARMQQYDALVDAESEALIATGKAILSFVQGPLVQQLTPSCAHARSSMDGGVAAGLNSRTDAGNQRPSTSNRPSTTASMSSRRSTRQRGVSSASSTSTATSARPSPPASASAAATAAAATMMMASSPLSHLTAPLPRPVGFFATALLSTVAEVVSCIQAEVAHWEDTDLMTGSDDEDEEGGMGGLANDPLNRSSSSSFAMSSVGASSMGDVPDCHVPPWEAEDAGGKSAYLVTLKQLLEVKQMLADVSDHVKVPVRAYEKPPRATSCTSTPQSLGGAMFELKPPHGEGSPSEGCLTGDTAVGLSPQDRAMVGTVALEPPAPLPPTLMEVIAREEQLLILRPGELLGPKPAPPLSAFCGTASGGHRGGFMKALLAGLHDDAQRLDAQRSVSLSLATHAPFWHKPPPHAMEGVPRSAPQTARHHVVSAEHNAHTKPTEAVRSASWRPGNHTANNGNRATVEQRPPTTQRPPVTSAVHGCSTRRPSLQTSDDLTWDVTRYDAIRDDPPIPLPLPNVYGGRLGEGATDDGGEGLFAPWAFSSATRSSRPGTAVVGGAAAHTAKVKEAKAKLVGARPPSSSKWTPQRPFVF